MARRSPRAGPRKFARTRRCCAPISAAAVVIREVLAMLEVPMLQFQDVDTYYGDLHVLKKVNYTIAAGEIVSLLGGNACGKSTTMKTIMGIVRPTQGHVMFDGRAIEKLSTAERVRRGIAPVLEARRLFPRMTV